MTWFVKYDLASGALRGTGEAPDKHLAAQAGPGEGVIPLDRDCLSRVSENDGRAVTVFDPTAVSEALAARIEAAAAEAEAAWPAKAAERAEIKRLKAAAKKALAAAANLAASAAAAQVDWPRVPKGKSDA